GDVINRAPDALEAQVATNTTLAVAPHVLELERQIGEPAHADLVDLLKAAAAAAPASGEGGVLYVTGQLLKGAAFAAMRSVDPPDAIRRSTDAEALADTVAWVEAASSIADQNRELSESEVYLEGQLLTAYSSRSEARQGANDSELLENRQRIADRLLTRALLAAAPSAPLILEQTVLQSRIDDRTTVVDFLL